MIGACARVAPCLAVALAGCADDLSSGLKVGAFRHDAVAACEVPLPGGDDVSKVHTSLTPCAGAPRELR
jgi:hypothetical protein